MLKISNSEQVYIYKKNIKNWHTIAGNKNVSIALQTNFRNLINALSQRQKIVYLLKKF